MNQKDDSLRLPKADEKLSQREIRVITLEENVLGENEKIADENRVLLQKQGVFTLNLISSPGSGKTTLLVETLRRLAGKVACAVIEGDQQTDRDARRIAETGVPVVQINTRSGCHLEALQVRRALDQLPLSNIRLLFIENVGNLVCPANFELGESEKIVLMSITEGEDKPVKYPLAFHLASAVIFTKMDLLPYLRFDLDKCKEFVRKVNPHAPMIETSAFMPDGLGPWLDWLQTKIGGYE